MSNKPIFASAADAEAAFYQALANSDLEAMMQVWSEDDEVVCVHSDSSRLVGVRAIRESWRQLFTGRMRLNVRTSHLVATANTLLAVHNVLEYIAVEGEDRLPPPLVATNIYTRGAHGWRLVVHHASPAPELPNAARAGDLHVVH